MDPTRKPPPPLVETRVFCVAEARQFGEERRVRLQRACAGETFFEAGGANGAWPRCTDLLCWNCAHPFEGPPLGLPKSYDERTEQFVVTGIFCGPGCVVRYAREHSPEQLVPRRLGWFGLFLRKAFGREYDFYPAAPPRYMLQAFGGPLTIEQFRNPGCLQFRELRKDEMIKDWVAEEVGVTVWGRLVSLRGVTAQDVEDALHREPVRPTKRPKPTETSLDTFFAMRRVKA